MKTYKIILFFSLLVSTFSFAANKPNSVYVLVKFNSTITYTQALPFLARSGLKFIEYIKAINVYKAEKINDSAFQANASELNNNTLYVEKDHPVHTFFVPNDPMYPDQKETQRIHPEGAWDISTGAKEVIIAISDTGYTFDHPDLSNQVWTNPHPSQSGEFTNDIHGWDFVGNDNDPTDEMGHGTHVAGIIGASGNNSVGVTGINFSTSIMPVRFLDAQGSGSNSNGIKTILYAADHGARLINASWGGDGFSQALLDAINYAYGKGTLLIAAAGNETNDNDASPSYPASYDSLGVIAVGSSESEGKLSSFSNFGLFSVDVVAPGTAILSTYPPNKYQRLSGTSMATPMVTGIAGLILSREPSLYGISLRNAILNSIDERNVYKGKISTRGDINATTALTQLSGGFQVWPSRITLKSGSQYQFTAFQASGSVSWSVSPSSLGSIDANGVLTAKADGDLTVTANDSGGHTASTVWLRVGVITNSGGGCKPANSSKMTAEQKTGSMLSFGLPVFIVFISRRKRVR